MTALEYAERGLTLATTRRVLDHALRVFPPLLLCSTKARKDCAGRQGGGNARENSTLAMARSTYSRSAFRGLRNCDMLQSLLSRGLLVTPRALATPLHR
jgi:hypothetical protein